MNVANKTERDRLFQAQLTRLIRRNFCGGYEVEAKERTHSESFFVSAMFPMYNFNIKLMKTHCLHFHLRFKNVQMFQMGKNCNCFYSNREICLFTKNILSIKNKFAVNPAHVSLGEKRALPLQLLSNFLRHFEQLLRTF